MKGILFKPDMIQAIVDLRKTQTRRLIKPQPKYLKGKVYSQWFWCKRNITEVKALRLGISHAVWWDRVKTPRVMTAFARYQVGETVYIKEAWTVFHCIGTLAGIKYMRDGFVTWVHIPASKPNPAVGYHSPMMMPEWAARHFLTILAVRAERLQEITEGHAIAEGVERMTYNQNEGWKNYFAVGCMAHSAVSSFNSLWNKLNWKRGYPWVSNPWVYLYEFEYKGGE